MKSIKDRSMSVNRGSVDDNDVNMRIVTNNHSPLWGLTQK